MLVCCIAASNGRDKGTLFFFKAMILCSLGRDKEHGMVVRSILDGGDSKIVIIDMVRVLALLATIACHLGARNWKGMNLDTIHSAFGVRQNSTLCRETKVQGGVARNAWGG